MELDASRADSSHLCREASADAFSGFSYQARPQTPVLKMASAEAPDDVVSFNALRSSLSRTRRELLSCQQPAKPFLVGLPPRFEAVNAFLGAKGRLPPVIADQPEPSTTHRTAPVFGSMRVIVHFSPPWALGGESHFFSRRSTVPHLKCATACCQISLYVRAPGARARLFSAPS